MDLVDFSLQTEPFNRRGEKHLPSNDKWTENTSITNPYHHQLPLPLHMLVQADLPLRNTHHLDNLGYLETLLSEMDGVRHHLLHNSARHPNVHL